MEPASLRERSGSASEDSLAVGENSPIASPWRASAIPSNKRRFTAFCVAPAAMPARYASCAGRPRMRSACRYALLLGSFHLALAGCAPLDEDLSSVVDPLAVTHVAHISTISYAPNSF